MVPALGKCDGQVPFPRTEIEHHVLERSYHVATLDYDRDLIEERAVAFATEVLGGTSFYDDTDFAAMRWNGQASRWPGSKPRCWSTSSATRPRTTWKWSAS